MKGNDSLPVKIFIAYARKDSDFLDALRAHMAPLIRSGRVQVWFDGLIEPGAIWSDTIKQNLHSADIILLMVSAHSLSSDYFYGKEVADAMERHLRGTARVIPLILRSCLWQETELGALQAIPQDGVPVEKWARPDDAYENALKSISHIIGEIEIQRAQAAETKRQQLEKQEQAATELARREQREHEKTVFPQTRLAGVETVDTLFEKRSVAGIETNSEVPAPPHVPESIPYATRQLLPYRKIAARNGILIGIFWGLSQHLNGPNEGLMWIWFSILPVVFIGRALFTFRKASAKNNLSFRQGFMLSLITGIIAAPVAGVSVTVNMLLANQAEVAGVSFNNMVLALLLTLLAGLLLSPFFAWNKQEKKNH